MKNFIFNIVAILVLIFATADYGYPTELGEQGEFTEFGLNEREYDAYSQMCPYGDAIVVFKDGHDEEVQCLNLIIYENSELKWETIKARDFKQLLYGGVMIVETHDPSTVKEISTASGPLTIEEAEVDLKNQKPLISAVIPGTFKKEDFIN